MPYTRHIHFYLPVLKVLEDLKEHEVNTLIEETANRCNLSENERQERTRKGTQLKYESNIQWAITDLCQGGFIERISRGIYVIAFDGLLMLEDNPKDPDRDYLEARSHKFREFRHRKGKKYKTEDTNDDNLFSNLSEEDVEYAEGDSHSNSIKSLTSTQIASDAQHMLEKCMIAREAMITAELDTTQVDNKIRLLREGLIRNSISNDADFFLKSLKNKRINSCAIVVDLFNLNNEAIYVSYDKMAIDTLCNTSVRISEANSMTIKDTEDEKDNNVKLDTELTEESTSLDKDLTTSTKKDYTSAIKRLRVCFSDGTIIEDKHAADVFAKAIEKIGPKRIIPLGLTSSGFPLVDKVKPTKYSFKTIDGGYFVPVNSSTPTKKRYLDIISSKLGLKLSVEIF